MYTVSSEIYKETNFEPTKAADGKVVSKFKFSYPSEAPGAAQVDQDGDLIVTRRGNSAKPEQGVIEIEHSEATELRLVGLQVWRGALLLADFFFHCRQELQDKQILELGAGVGLTSIAAAIFAARVVCTDVDIGGILNLIRSNVARNRKLFTGEVQVLEYDFMQPLAAYTQSLLKDIDASDIVVAADTIYDDELTDAFIRVIDIIFQREAETGRRKTLYVALEKRFVFTLADCDSVAPMFEYFLKQTSQKPWHFTYIPIDFPQYFRYTRCKELLLLKLTSRA